MAEVLADKDQQLHLAAGSLVYSWHLNVPPFMQVRGGYRVAPLVLGFRFKPSLTT